jgi:hypothetical protein
MLRRVDWHEFTELIVLMMEAARSSETSVNFYQTTRSNFPDDNHLQRVKHFGW